MKRARNYYLLSHRRKPDWTLHFRYFESLHSVDAQVHADEIVYRQGNLILWHNFLPWRLVQLLRDVVLSHPDRISSKARSRVIQAIQAKIRRRMPVRQGARTAYSPSSAVSFDSSYDATSIRDLLVDIAFATQAKCGNMSFFPDALDWAIWETRTAMDPSSGSVTKDSGGEAVTWNNIRLLAMSYGLPNFKEHTAFDSSFGRSPSIGWTVVCSLAGVESSITGQHPQQLPSLSMSTNPVLPDGLHDTARTLWMLWRNYVQSSRGGAHLSATVICCVLVSFLRLVTLLRDLPLKGALTTHIADELVYPALYGGQFSLTEGALIAVAVEYAVMCTVIHKIGTWDVILGQVQEAQLYPAGVQASVWRAAVANGVLLQLIRHDMSLAYGLYRAVDEDLSLVVSSHTICALGEALASAGFVELACVCLFDKRLQGAARGRVLGCLLSHIARSRQHSPLDAQTVRSLAQAIAYASDHLRANSSTSWSMERCLLLLLEAGHFSEAAEAVNFLQAKSPDILRPSFINSFFSRLLASRRHRLLATMVSNKRCGQTKSLLPNQPRFNYLRRLIGRDGTSPRQISRSILFSLNEWPTLRRFLRFNPKLAQQDAKLVSLQLSSELSRQIEANSSTLIDGHTMERVVLTLVRAGRMRAALKYADAALSRSPSTDDSPKRMPTTVGNIILAGSLLPRQKRRSMRQLRHATGAPGVPRRAAWFCARPRHAESCAQGALALAAPRWCGGAARTVRPTRRERLSQWYIG